MLGGPGRLTFDPSASEGFGRPLNVHEGSRGRGGLRRAQGTLSSKLGAKKNRRIGQGPILGPNHVSNEKGTKA